MYFTVIEKYNLYMSLKNNSEKFHLENYFEYLTLNSLTTKLSFLISWFY